MRLWARQDPGFAIGVIRSDTRPAPLHLSDRAMNLGVAVFGGTGFGKTTTLSHFVYHAIATGLPLIVLDGKGDAAWAARIAGWARAAGRPVYLWSADGPDSWNPLAQGSPTELADKLLSFSEWSEPHYEFAAARFLQSLFTVLRATGQSVTLPGLLSLASDERAMGTLGRRVGPVAQPLFDTLSAWEADRSLHSAVLGLVHRLAVVAESDAGPYLASDGINLQAVLRDEAAPVVVFTLPALRYPKFVPILGSMVLLDLRTALASLYRDDRQAPSMLVADEFGAIASPQALGILAQARGAGMRTVVATQDLVDLAQVDPQLPQQVLSNTAIKLIHRVGNPDSAELLARAIGTRKGHELTHQIRPWDGGLGELGTVRAVDEFVVHPQVLKALDPGMAAFSVAIPTAQAGLVQIFPSAEG